MKRFDGICAYCEESFAYIAYRKNRLYCSDRCRKAQEKAKARERKQQDLKTDGELRDCAHCGTSYRAYSAGTKYCSDICRYKVGNSRKPKQIRIDTNDNCSICEKPVKRSASSKPDIVCHDCRRDIKAKEATHCEQCKASIPPNTNNYYRRRFCSLECSNLFQSPVAELSSDPRENARERSRRKNRARRKYILDTGLGKYTLREIAARDGYFCAACLGPVDMTLSGLDKWGPTIDHTIPISKGGLDTVDNVKLMHRDCNVKKSDGLAS